jgi:hypothetical protein
LTIRGSKTVDLEAMFGKNRNDKTRRRKEKRRIPMVM